MKGDVSVLEVNGNKDKSQGKKKKGLEALASLDRSSLPRGSTSAPQRRGAAGKDGKGRPRGYHLYEDGALLDSTEVVLDSAIGTIDLLSQTFEVKGSNGEVEKHYVFMTLQEVQQRHKLRDLAQLVASMANRVTREADGDLRNKMLEQLTRYAQWRYAMREEHSEVLVTIDELLRKRPAESTDGTSIDVGGTPEL